MSNKKSYMDTKNILSEGALGAFFRGLFKGKKGMQRDAAKFEREVELNVKDFNKRNRKLEKMIEKRYVVGDNPLWYELDDVESIDIDTEFDLRFVEFLVENNISELIS